MATSHELVGAKMPWLHASMLGQQQNTAVAAAGSTATDATTLTAEWSLVTTVAANAGVKLRTAGASPMAGVYNAGANTLTIYPATGEKINNGAANVGVSCASGKSVFFMPCNTQWIALFSA